MGLPSRKGHATLPNIYAANRYPNLQQITRVMCNGEKLSNQNSKRLFDAASQLMFGELKLHCGSQARQVTYACHGTNVVLLHVHLSGWLLNSPSGYFLRCRMYNQNRHIQKMTEFPFWFSDLSNES